MMGILDELDRLLDRAAEQGADFVEQESYDQKCLPVIKLQSCISWAKKCGKQKLNFYLT